MNILYIVHFGGNFVSDRNYFEIKKGREGRAGGCEGVEGRGRGGGMKFYLGPN